MEIQVQPLSGHPLVDDYLAQDPRILDFFPGSPFDPEAYAARKEAIAGRFDDEHRRAMAEAVRPLSREAADRLDAVRAGDGFFVTTGQQPGLFGGPLYSIYKALSAIALAAALEKVVDAPVLPLFWVASDDHDWAEANHVHLLDTGNSLVRLTLEGGAEPPRSMGRRRLGGTVESTLNELSQALPPSEFAPILLERLRRAWSPDRTVAAAFMETLAGLLDGLPVGLVDGQSPVVRRLALPVVRAELSDPEASEAALRGRTEALETAGYGVQVPILEGASNVFLEDDEGGRERLIRSGDGWLLRSSGRPLGAGEVEGMLAREPDRFSANVVLRPVVESAVFPTLAYVGGPGEIRYLAQTAGLFERHGVPMPVVYPRWSVTLVESKVGKVLEKFGLEASAFHRPVAELIAERVREEVPEEVTEEVSRLRSRIGEGYAALLDAARVVDATLKGPINGARNEAFRGLAEVEKKIRHHVKLAGEVELEQIEKAAVNLAPLGKPQERVLNVHQYLARYGDELIPSILDRISAETHRTALEAEGV
jgi:bacillithiol synthase